MRASRTQKIIRGHPCPAVRVAAIPDFLNSVYEVLTRPQEVVSATPCPPDIENNYTSLYRYLGTPGKSHWISGSSLSKRDKARHSSLPHYLTCFEERAQESTCSYFRTPLILWIVGYGEAPRFNLSCPKTVQLLPPMPVWGRGVPLFFLNQFCEFCLAKTIDPI